VRHQLVQKTPPRKRSQFCGEPESRQAVATRAKRWAHFIGVSLRYVLIPREIVLCDQGPKAKVTRVHVVMNGIELPDTIRIDRLRALS
jgi:hypothetical protein